MADSGTSPPTEQRSPPGLVEHFFRHESGRLIASLVRRFGVTRLALIEDAVQASLAVAIRTWSRDGVPSSPSAWLSRAAKNRVIDELRRAHHRDESLDAEGGTLCGSSDPDPPGYAGEIFDDELRMLFVCCDEQIKPRMQLVLALKLLCGFSTKEIAARLFSTESNVQKLLERGRERLRDAYDPMRSGWSDPASPSLAGRLPAVLKVVYLLFNEGYSSMQSERVIRHELCREALRLGEILAQHPIGGTPDTHALLALMMFHYARLDARLDDAGGLLLLEEQDRAKWNLEVMRQGAYWLWRSGQGDHFSRFHAEAAVMMEHCMAPTFAQTRWGEIVELYATLEKLEPSPLHTLNRAIALAEWKGPQAGLELLIAMKPPNWLTGYYLWDATQGELLRRCGRFDEAIRFLERAHGAAPTEPERRVFQKKLARARVGDPQR